MKELWDNALLGYNLPLTGLLVVVAIYWLLSLIGTVDLDTFDIDLDADLDADVDADGEGASSGDGPLSALLRFVNAQDVPLMVVLSTLISSLWAVSILGNYYLNPGQSYLIASGLFLGNLVISLVVVKILTHPMRGFFRSLNNDKEHQEPLIGLTGRVKSRVLDETFGQVEVDRVKGAPALLNVVLSTGQRPLTRGDEIIVIGFNQEIDKFIVRSTTMSESVAGQFSEKKTSSNKEKT